MFVPNESLIPGLGARYSDGPDFFSLRLVLPDGRAMHNHGITDRYTQTPPDDPQLRPATSRGTRYEHLSFESGYEPRPDEPGRDRWLSLAPNGLRL